MDLILEFFYNGVVPITILIIANLILFFVNNRKTIITANLIINMLLIIMFAWIISISREHIYSDLIIYHMPFLREESLRLVYNLSDQIVVLLIYGVVNTALLYTKFVYNSTTPDNIE